MKLLIVTQKVDVTDPVLGFFTRWIEEFAKQCEKITVVCLQKGAHTFPHNVEVLSLGKEGFKMHDARIKRHRSSYALRFLTYIWKRRNDYDSVFVHMNPEYVILGSPLWKMLGKHVVFWYVHGSINAKLRLAEKLSDKILTASEESFRLPSPKVEVVGHGIDTELFSGKADRTGLTLLTVSRIAPVKDLTTLILGFCELRKKIEGVTLDIVGEPVVKSDEVYQKELAVLIATLGLSDAVRFLGAVPFGSLPAVYNEHTVFIHASRTGSVDKAVLEALSCGLPVCTSSEAFIEAPGVLRFRMGDFADMAEKIRGAFERGELGYNAAGREWVAQHHKLSSLIGRIIDSLEA